MHARLAISSATVILARCKVMLHHGVADHDTNPALDRQQFVVETSAIEQQGMIGPAKTGDELVHDAALGSGILVLGTLTRQRDITAIDLEVGGGQQRESGRNFDRRRRTQSCADRYFTFDHQVRAPDGNTPRPHDARDSTHVVAPMAAWSRLQAVELEAPALA